MASIASRVSVKAEKTHKTSPQVCVEAEWKLDSRLLPPSGSNKVKSLHVNMETEDYKKQKIN